MPFFLTTVAVQYVSHYWCITLKVIQSFTLFSGIWEFEKKICSWCFKSCCTSTCFYWIFQYNSSFSACGCVHQVTKCWVFVFHLFPLQDPANWRPKEIPHNEKLLSLKYEVKYTTSCSVLSVLEKIWSIFYGWVFLYFASFINRKMRL